MWIQTVLILNQNRCNCSYFFFKPKVLQECCEKKKIIEKGFEENLKCTHYHSKHCIQILTHFAPCPSIDSCLGLTEGTFLQST